MKNQKNDWVQTYGNDSSHLKSDYANIVAVDYLSDGKTLDATLWLKSNLENSSTYSQPLKKNQVWYAYCHCFLASNFRI